MTARRRTLAAALPAALDALAAGGRAVVMSYQSLEDKIVKTVFAGISVQPQNVDSGPDGAVWPAVMVTGTASRPP